ncbi:hypothetical protein [Burkholderia sp.]|uniref:hypothetical protein n=1 Tax=Burkholderia sp. TaxID=36773 RepID=UPI0025BC5218|nr:hypothetical protein [Burkholderia sp.]MBS6361948.1 hypothetical protein [Burkholderia sp.]
MTSLINLYVSVDYASMLYEIRSPDSAGRAQEIETHSDGRHDDPGAVRSMFFVEARDVVVCCHRLAPVNAFHFYLGSLL